jgi:hypothetical protein
MSQKVIDSSYSRASRGRAGGEPRWQDSNVRREGDGIGDWQTGLHHEIDSRSLLRGESCDLWEKN